MVHKNQRIKQLSVSSDITIFLYYVQTPLPPSPPFQVLAPKFFSRVLLEELLSIFLTSLQLQLVLLFLKPCDSQVMQVSQK